MRKLHGAALLPILLCASCGGVRLDENLCPRDRSPPRTTLLLLDTSDPLSAKHREELRRLVSELQDAKAKELPAPPVAPGEALVVYQLGGNLDDLQPVLQVCNPGEHPDDWEWWQELVRGKRIEMQRWRRFQDRVEALYGRIETSTAQRTSPIIETLGVIVPRHAPSWRTASTDAGRTHLVLFSDLLQHSEALSHYGDYPAADAIHKTPGLRALQTKLAGVDVSLYRLERSRAGRWQTTKHYYWWTHLVQSFRGKVVSQESI